MYLTNTIFSKNKLLFSILTKFLSLFGVILFSFLRQWCLFYDLNYNRHQQRILLSKHLLRSMNSKSRDSGNFSIFGGYNFVTSTTNKTNNTNTSPHNTSRNKKNQNPKENKKKKSGHIKSASLRLFLNKEISNSRNKKLYSKYTSVFGDSKHMTIIILFVFLLLFILIVCFEILFFSKNYLHMVDYMIVFSIIMIGYGVMNISI